ncbi:hypothetical protein LY76DRAFT_364562 [Colletotrichum caudatum]|nr:hypothetical protein LY76DRAFT_364562 [Colletotrichum caudatum]
MPLPCSRFALHPRIRWMANPWAVCHLWPSSSHLPAVYPFGPGFMPASPGGVRARTRCCASRACAEANLFCPAKLCLLACLLAWWRTTDHVRCLPTSPILNHLSQPASQRAWYLFVVVVLTSNSDLDISYAGFLHRHHKTASCVTACRLGRLEPRAPSASRPSILSTVIRPRACHIMLCDPHPPESLTTRAILDGLGKGLGSRFLSLLHTLLRVTDIRPCIGPPPGCALHARLVKADWSECTCYAREVRRYVIPPAALSRWADVLLSRAGINHILQSQDRHHVRAPTLPISRG